MNLGQSLMAILSLVLFTTITLSINRTRIIATNQTIDHQVDLEAINYGQSLMEIISNIANTESGFFSLKYEFDNTTWSRTFTTGSGRTLYAHISIEDSGLTKEGVDYKLAIISVYSDASMTGQHLKSKYQASFNKWW